MIRRSVVLKLWFTVVGLVVIVLLVLAIYLQQLFNSNVEALQSRDLSSQTLLAAQVLSKASPSYLMVQTVQELSSNHSHYYMIPVGGTAAGSLDRFIRGLSPAERRLLHTGMPIVKDGQPLFLTHEDPQTEMYAVCPIRAANGSLRAYLVVTESRRLAVDLSTTIPAMIVFSVILGTLLATGLAFVISKNLSRPLLEMNKAAEKLAEGKFDIRVRVATVDEVGRLGNTLNHVATELEQSMIALIQEKEQMAGILNAMMDIVIATDIKGHTTLLNPSAELWLRRARTLSMHQQEEGDDVSEWPDELRELRHNALSAHKPINAELQWFGREMAVTMTPLYEPDHVTELRGTLAVMRDVTDEKHLDLLRKDFVANVSHELRTPLTLLQGYAEALMDNFGEDPEQQADLVRIIHDETLRMRRLVNELLDLAQMESGHFSMRMEYIELSSIVRRVAKKFHGVIQERGLQLLVESDPTPLQVRGDADRLEQVLTNLIDNALRHTKQGSISIWTEAADQQAVIRVRDTGEGISEADLPFVFDRFFKADKARIRTGGTGGGTGIGLAIVSSLIRAHHGEIGVQSSLGVGTTFTIIIPLTK